MGSLTTEAEWPLRIVGSFLTVAGQSQNGCGTLSISARPGGGLLGTDYLKVVGTLDALGCWPFTLDGLVVADVGCFTGGITALLAHRGPEKVVAVDEVAAHLSTVPIGGEHLRDG